MKYAKMPEIGSGSNLLLGRQSTDYFNFVCGDCGKKITRIMVEDVDGVGFRFTAKCSEECEKEWTELKISAVWGKPMEPHITGRFHEISSHMRSS